MNQNNLIQENQENEPKIYGVFINEQNQKQFNRRDFIKAVALAGSTIALKGCIPLDATQEDRVENDARTRLPTNTPAERPTDTKSSPAMGEVTYSHTMFSGPHVDHPIITKTVLGEVVTILGRTPDGIWFQIIDSNKNIGWVFSEFITLLNDVVIPDTMDFPTRFPGSCTCDIHDEPPPCPCDSHSSGGDTCECDEVCTCDSVHYWYPT